jgi:hypothetical protein
MRPEERAECGNREGAAVRQHLQSVAWSFLGDDSTSPRGLLQATESREGGGENEVEDEKSGPLPGDRDGERTDD